MAGRFVTFEGIDGTGKSSTIKRVAAALRSAGHDVVETREETATERGEWVRRSIAAQWDPLATALLFAADRAEHVREIQAWLAAGKTVLCDRFVHSSYAYQGVTLAGRVPDPVGFVRRLHEPWCPMPDLVVLLQGDPAKCLERVTKRGEKTRYEKLEFLTKVQVAYLEEARRDPKRFVVIDADGSLDAQADAAIAAVRKAM